VHLLYVDESGEASDATQKYFVLAGVCVFERMTHWVAKSMDDVASKIYLGSPEKIEFHGSPMRSGKGIWRQISPRVRELLIIEALTVGILRQPARVRIFACAVEKEALKGRDPVHACFEQLVRCFDLFLLRCHRVHDDSQRGLMLFDESGAEHRLQALARDFKQNGHSYGKTRNFAEVPVFLDSRATRLIQLADLVAHSIFRKLEHCDARFWNVIRDRIDSFVLLDSKD